jgi:coenzyme F420-0:L-glutamate ligase
MQLTPIRTHVFKEGADLIPFLIDHLPRLEEKNIIVIASKIVSLAERRTLDMLSDRKKAALIRAESRGAVKTKYVWLTLKGSMVMANAGIDESNADGRLILLPEDSYASAKSIRAALKKHYGLKDLGVVIADSCPLPLRAGVTSLALGYAGFRGTRDYRGKKDISGRVLRMTRTNVVDGLTAAAGVLMGEGAERQPLVLIQDAPVAFTAHDTRGELSIPLSDDMYGPLFKNAGL